MTIVFLNDGETLLNRYVYRQFTATLPLAYACVDYFNPLRPNEKRAQEIVWRDGAFQYPYDAKSTKVGNLYTVVRESGWTESLHLRAEEQTPAPTTFWTVLYEQDLRTLPNRVIVGDSNTFAAFTMDGQPWYVHTASGDLQLINGQGLVGGVRGDSHNGNPYGGMHFGLRADNMAGYNPVRQTACQIQYSGDLASMLGSVGASAWSSGDSWGYGPGNNSQLVKLYSDHVEYWVNPGAFGAAYSSSWLAKVVGPAEQVENFTLATSSMPISTASSNRDGTKNYRAGYFTRDQGFPSMEKMAGLGIYNGIGNAEDTQLRIGGWAGYNSGSNKTFTAIRIRVMQRDLP